MEIDSKSFIEIMNRNFGFEVVETSLGKGIKVNNLKAFIYSSITGAGYLDNPVYPFTIKGLTKLFYNAFDYKFVTGLFDNTNLKNTPYQLSKAKPFLFDSDKIIIPVEFKTELELQKKLENFIDCLKDKPTNYLIQRIEISKKGNGMEPFMEYLACEYLKDNYFIVENQIPLTHSAGSPDFGAYCLNSEKKFFSKIHILELSLLRLGLELNLINKEQASFLVGEAKTSTTNMKVQLKKYLKTGIFNKGIEIHPDKKVPSEDFFGILSLDENYKINYIPPRKQNPFLDKSKQREYSNWLSNYFKFYLLANLTNDEFIKFFEIKKKKSISSKQDIIYFVSDLNFEDILNEIKRVVKNGIIK